MMLINTYAHNFNGIYVENSDSEEYSGFNEIKEDYEFVSEKVSEELSVNSSEISNSEVESFLNSNGVFDDEITDIYGENDIKEFENMDEEDISNMTVEVSYFAVEDTEDDGEDISNTNIIQLTDEEVDMYMAEKYYGQDMGLEEQLIDKFDDKKSNDTEEQSIFKEVMENIGLKAKDAYAETQTKQRRNDGTLCMLKKVVTCTKPNDKYVSVKAVVVWDEMPVNRKLDSIGIHFKNAQYEDDAVGGMNKIEMVHFYTRTITEGPAGKYVTYTNTINEKINESNSPYLKANQYDTQNSGVVIALKLTPDEDKLKDNGDRFIRKITKEGVRCNMYVKLTSETKKYLRMNVDYIHIKTSYNPIETLISIIDRAYITAAYRLATGADIKVSYEMSGVNEYFKFNFK